MLIDFCLPVRNEENILASNLLKLRDFIISQNYNFNWQIVVILNNCTDKSENIIKKLVLKNSDKFSYYNINPAGKSGALKYYFTISEADVLVYMDIDLAVSLENLNELLAPLISGNADLVIGSRLLESSKVERSFFRSSSSLIYNYLSRIFLNHNFRDLQCGFKAFKREVFLKVEPFLRDDKWFFDTELVLLSKYFKFRIKEIPVNWAENRYAQRVSKVSVYRNVCGFLNNMLRLRRQIKNLK